MKSLFFFFLFIGISTLGFAQIKIGEKVDVQYASPHPYPISKSSNSTVVWTQIIELDDKKMTYIAVHFDRFQIEKGDKLQLRNSVGKLIKTYTSRHNSVKGFWSIPILGNSVQLELVSNAKKGNYGYSVDRLTKGMLNSEVIEKSTICDSDDSKEAICYKDSEPGVYSKSKAVVRIWIGSEVMEPHCTGWFFGSEGHIMTAGHCTINWHLQNSDVYIELMGETDDCMESCEGAGLCQGQFIDHEDHNIIVLKEVDNIEFDYSLSQLTEYSPQDYLQARASGAVIGERIYVPQHPLGHGKRIALESDSPHDPNGFPELIELVDQPTRIGHYADTESKSSGSPVISYEDNLVVGLHTSGGCPNGAVEIEHLLVELAMEGLMPNDGISDISCERKNVKIVDSHETWSTIDWIPGDIVVKYPGQLTLNSTIFLTPESSIFVERGAKLIVDGGTISSCGAERWKGIVVEGANETALNGQLADPFDPTDNTYAGTVIIQNGGTIDNAIDGITTKNRQYTWSERSKYRGGLIYCNDARFTNCFRAVEFFPYGDLANPDKSVFHDTQFTDLTLGVTNWSSDGVTFTQCQFENIERTAAGGYDAAINLYGGNSFVNVSIGVNLTGTTMKPNSSQIGMDGTSANQFLSGQIGVLLTAVNNLTETNIINNNFYCENGVLLDGINLAAIELNDFLVSNNGVIAFDAKNSIDIENNAFEHNSTAIHTIWDNSFLTFSNNCMENSGYEDVWIYGDEDGSGNIFDFQGAEDFGAGNCFSKSQIPEIITDGSTQSFIYFVESNTSVSDCLNPEFAGNFTVDFSQNTADPNCGSTGQPVGPPSQFCEPGLNITTLLADIQQLDNEIAQLTNSSGSSFVLNGKKRCLDLSLRTLARLYQTNEDYSSLHSFFGTRPEFQMRTIPFSDHIQKEDYAAARSYLQNLTTITVEEINYKMVGGIYLNYLETENYTLNANDQFFLENTGLAPGPLNGYARSVYHRITGQRIELNLPVRNRSNPREQEASNDLDRITIFPNPTHQHELNIIGINESVNVELFDSMGKRVSHFPNLSQSKIALAPECKGIYFVRISNGKDILVQEKLIIL